VSPHRHPLWHAAVAIVCASCGSPAGDHGADASTPSPDGGACSSCTPADGGAAGADGNGPLDGEAGPGVEAGSDGSGGGGPPGSVLTYHNDNGRTGQNLDETVLTPSNVNSTTFGKKFAQPVDSYVYAQPLLVPGLTIGGATHDVVFVATENNSVYAFDGNASVPALWHINVGTSLSCSDLQDCGDLVPGAGITGTPSSIRARRRCTSSR